MKIILRWILNAVFLMAIPYIVPGVSFSNFYAALIAALVLGIINALIRPLILLLTLPVNIITLGLFTLIINGFLFWLTATIVKGFFVTGFWPAFFGAVLFSLFAAVLNAVDKDK